MTRNLLCTAAALAAAVFIGAAASPASAYQVYFGEDLNNSAWKPLATTKNATAAEEEFLSVLTGVGTEDFEEFSSKQHSPLSLSFPGAGKATLAGGRGSIDKVKPGTTNGAGRYAISGKQFWEVGAGGKGNFTVAFSDPVAAFGFYGIDIGDFGGQLVLQLDDAANTVLKVDNTAGSWGSTDGSVMFFGVVAQTKGELFTKVSFETTTGQGDVFAFDNMTIGSLEQVKPSAIPEPSTLALLGVGTIGSLTILRRRLG